MDREILFRGRSFSDGSWVYGDLEYERNKGSLGKVRIHTYKDNGRYNRQYLVDQDTVGEFIGKKDKNSIKIFEGDIVRRKESAYGLEDIGVVRYDCHLCAFVLEYESYGEVCQDTFDDEFSEEDGHYTIDGTYSYEVIGNIHANPDLLSSKQA